MCVEHDDLLIDFPSGLRTDGSRTGLAIVRLKIFGFW